MSNTPVDILVEMNIGGTWTDVTTDVRLGDADSGGGIHIKRGKANESNIAEPTELDFTLNNAEGKYSPDNPLSPYFGLIGRNTPVRCGCNQRIDTFTRTSVNSWGSFTKTVLDRWGNTFATYTETYVLNGTAANFDVASGTGTIQAATGYQSATFGAYGDCEILAKMKVSNRTSEFGVMMRANGSATEFYSLYITPDTTDVLRLGKVASGVSRFYFANQATNVVADTYYWFKFQNHGHRFQGRFWKDGDDEPTSWISTGQMRAWDTGYSYGENTPADVGAVGVFAKDGTALLTVDSFQVTQWLAHAEITKPPIKYDLSRQDRWVDIKARGMLQRINQGKKNLDSAVTRHYSSYVGVPMWYPLESTDTETASTPVSGGQPAAISGLSFAADDATPGLLGLASFDTDTSSLHASIPAFTVTTAWTYTQFYAMGTPASDALIAEVQASGTIRKWRITHQSNDYIRVDALNAANLVSSTDLAALQGASNADIPIGSVVVFALYVNNSGGDINWALNYHRPGSTSFWTTGTNTITSPTASIGVPKTLTMQSSAVHTAAGNMRAAQAMIYPGDLPFVTNAFAKAARAHIDEDDRARFQRLGNELGIRTSIYGQPTAVTPMGPQRPLPPKDLFEECANAGDNILMEARSELAVELRLHRTLLNQNAMAMDIDDGHVSDPLDPLPDDQGTRNDVTVNRVLGGFARSVQETGPLNIQDPADDPINGVGTYDTAPTLNLSTVAQCLPTANFIRGRGTLPDPRYASMRLNLISSVYDASRSLTARAVSLDSGDMVSLTNVEVNPNAIEQIVQSYEDEIDLYEWQRTLVTTPGRAYRVGQLGITTWLDTSYIETASSFSAGSGTSLSIQRTDATKGLWVLPGDSPASFPHQIIVSGVVLNVTSASGSSDPQTLTVDATPLNGIVKTIPANSPVKLFNAWRLALRGNN